MPWAVGDPTLDALNPLTGSGSPEGVTVGQRGQFYFDTASSVLYVMTTSDDASTGWRPLYTSVDFASDHGSAAHNYAATVHNHTESQISDLNHYDSTAMHTAVSGEVNGIAAKTTPVSADVLLLEDSAASFQKRKVTVGSLLPKITVVSSSTGLDADDGVVFVDSTSGPVTITLATTASVNGQAALVKRIAGTNNVTVARAGSDTIVTDGSSVTAKTLADVGASWAGGAVSSSSAWYTIGEHGSIT